MKLAGRYAVITGAGRGLGAEIARSYVAEGASVLLCARSADELSSVKAALSQSLQPGQVVEVHVTDVSEKAQVDALMQRALALFPHVDAIVCNAGVYGPFGQTEDVDLDAWAQAMQINLMGTLYSCRAAIPHFKARGYGKIVVVSGGGATSPLPNLSAYAASKAAVVRLTETLAGELKDWHIDINSVAPGLLATSLQDGLLAAGPERIGEAFYARMKRDLEAGGDSIERAAELCVYLASSESDGLTGRLISAKWDAWPFSAEALAAMKPDTYTLRRVVPEEG